MLKINDLNVKTNDINTEKELKINNEEKLNICKEKLSKANTTYAKISKLL